MTARAALIAHMLVTSSGRGSHRNHSVGSRRPRLPADQDPPATILYMRWLRGTVSHFIGYQTDRGQRAHVSRLTKERPLASRLLRGDPGSVRAYGGRCGSGPITDGEKAPPCGKWNRLAANLERSPTTPASSADTLSWAARSASRLPAPCAGLG